MCLVARKRQSLYGYYCPKYIIMLGSLDEGQLICSIVDVRRALLYFIQRCARQRVSCLACIAFELLATFGMRPIACWSVHPTGSMYHIACITFSVSFKTRHCVLQHFPDVSASAATMPGPYYRYLPRPHAFQNVSPA